MKNLVLILGLALVAPLATTPAYAGGDGYYNEVHYKKRYRRVYKYYRAPRYYMPGCVGAPCFGYPYNAPYYGPPRYGYGPRFYYGRRGGGFSINVPGFSGAFSW